MKLKRVVSKKTGRVGFRGRYIDPLTRKRIKKTFWFAERLDAENAVKSLLSARGRREYNIPDESGWKLTYVELVKRFLAAGVVKSEQRLAALRKFLTLNLLGITVAGEFAGRGTLRSKCTTLAVDRGEAYVNKCVLQPLKQLSAWAAEHDIIPHDPLRDLKKLKRENNPAPHKRAFTAEEIRAIIKASDELDALNGCPYPLSVAFKTLLLTGNRPGAVAQANVGDFDEKRITLPPGRGKKRNGTATIPPAFVVDLQRYFLMRGRPAAEEPLLVSGEGARLDGRNLRDAFKRAATLAFVQLCWPNRDPHTQFATPLEVALSIHNGRLAGFSGAPPTDEAKKALRARRKAAVLALTELLKPQVEKRLADRPVYALRATHITWARRFVEHGAVRKQVGHAARDVQEQHYNDGAFIDAGLSSQAVWDVLTGVKELQKQEEKVEVLPMAVGQMAPIVAPVGKIGENGMKKTPKGFSQVKGNSGEGRNAPWRTRTSDPVIKSHLLYQLS